MSTRPQLKSRAGSRVEQYSKSSFVDQTISTPNLTREASSLVALRKIKKDKDPGEQHTPRDGRIASEPKLSARQDATKPADPTQLVDIVRRGDNVSEDIFNSGDMYQALPNPSRESRRCSKTPLRSPQASAKTYQAAGKHQERPGSCCSSYPPKKKPVQFQYIPPDVDDSWARQISEIHFDTQQSARLIKFSRARLLQIQRKPNLSDADTKELGERNESLLREMERFDRLTKNIQKLVASEVKSLKKTNENPSMAHMSGIVYEPPLFHEMRMNHPTVLLAGKPTSPRTICEPDIRSKSEIDLTRKLSESYDMQEKLVADNADLEVKRYILYKELMTKDQNLETCRAQIKRLQGELKMMNKENSLLHDKMNKNNPEGDAAALNQTSTSQKELEDSDQEKATDTTAEQLIEKLAHYKSSTQDLEKQIGALELEVGDIRTEMSACRNAGGGPHTCYKPLPRGAPPVAPTTKACGVCPPCPAPCTPHEPPKPEEKEVARLTILLRQYEENYRTKITECSQLRAEMLKKREELDKERKDHRECQSKLRDLELRFDGLTAHTNLMLGTKEQQAEDEVNVKALKRCYREAREEIDELRLLLKEQNEQLQDYRSKYMQAQQLVEEQRRQLEIMDMDNSRISEQINLEIQRIKFKFQEKLQELSPLPDLLKATQLRLKDARASQALSEHSVEQLTKDLTIAREKVHMLLHNSLKQPEKGPDTTREEKQIAMLEQRVCQLNTINMTYRTEIERLKANVIRMEEAVLSNEKRLYEKMNECAQLGGDLDRCRDEAARALTRANERLETNRSCLQSEVSEMEKSLASARAQASSAEKEREELQIRMQGQITRLNEKFEQAQTRIMGLMSELQTLRRTISDDGDSEDNLTCMCKQNFHEL